MHNTECSQIQKAPAFSFTHLISFSAVLVLLADWLPLGLFLCPRSIEDGPTHTVLSVYKSPIQLRNELRAAGLREPFQISETQSPIGPAGVTCRDLVR